MLPRQLLWEDALSELGIQYTRFLIGFGNEHEK